MPRLMQRRAIRRPDMPEPDFNASGDWRDRGFASKAAAQSVSKGLGLMKQPGGGWGRPTMDQFTQYATNLGYGPQQQVRNPLAVGGARWMVGGGAPKFTGQATDAAGGGGNAYTDSQQVPYQPFPKGGGKLRPRTGDAPNLGNIPGMQMPHTQIGQQGRGTGERKGNLGRPAGAGKPGGKLAPKVGAKPGAGKPGAGPMGATIAKPGAFPAAPPAVPNYLPMTPGYEAAYRGANDQLAAAEGSYAASGALLPAQIGQQRARLQTDQDVATDRLKEQLAERGIFTPYGAGSTARNPEMAASPAGGGVGESLYNRNVATPFGRSRQDLGASAAKAYGTRALDYGGAQLGFNQQLFDALLGRANDAYAAMPLSLPIGGYELPEMAGPMFSAPPGGGAGKPGRNRNRNGNRNRGRGKRGSRRK